MGKFLGYLLTLKYADDRTARQRKDMQSARVALCEGGAQLTHLLLSIMELVL